MPKLNKSIIKKILVLTTVFVAVLVAGVYQKSQSASLTNVSVTLSNSRLSFRGALTTGNTTGSSSVIIETTTGDYPSTTSAQLVSGDVVSIGNGNSLADYTVTSVISASTFNVTPVLAAGDSDDDDVVISTQSATQTVRFTTANAIANGRFRILIPSDANDADASDGIPDRGNFDFGNSAPTVTCPSNADAVYDFVTGTATASAITIGSQEYHSYECAYSGTGAIGTAFNGSNGIVITDIINPAPKTAHSTGLADTHRIIIQHINSGFTVSDTTTVSVGVIEAVRITASVAPQITFQISGIASGVTACGVSTDVSTTAAAVPLGELSISAFTDAAQSLSVSTNATNGYAVTAVANDQLGRDAGTCAGDPTTNADCIQDSRGDTATMSHTTPDEWAVAANKGFAFSLDNANGTGLTAAFEYGTVSGGCTGGYCARQFADAEGSQAPQTIFSATDVADEHNLYVCYRAIVPSTQAAGDYENHVTYTATATF